MVELAAGFWMARQPKFLVPSLQFSKITVIADVLSLQPGFFVSNVASVSKNHKIIQKHFAISIPLFLSH